MELDDLIWLMEILTPNYDVLGGMEIRIVETVLQKCISVMKRQNGHIPIVIKVKK